MNPSPLTDSFELWLGSLPAGWSLKKLSREFGMIGSGTTPPTDNSSWYGEGVPWVTTGELRENDIIATEKSVTPAALQAFPALRRYPAGTLLVAMYGATIGRTAILKCEATVNQACCALAAPMGLVPRYVFHWLNAFRDELVRKASGGGQPNVNQDTIRDLRISAPSVQEQGRIAGFLDDKTARINALIAEKEDLLPLLIESEARAIVSLVTGMEHGAMAVLQPGTISGSALPVGWKFPQLSRLTEKLTNGFVGPTRDILASSGVRYLQSLHIKSGQIDFARGEYYVRPEWSEAHAKSILKVGDVLIVQTGDIGQTAVVTKEFEGCNCHALIIASPIRHVVLPEYLELVLRSTYGRACLDMYATGALHPHLNCSNIRDIHIPIPALALQQEIIERARAVQQSHRELAIHVSEHVDRLREYRTSLISAAVTGQLAIAA